MDWTHAHSTNLAYASKDRGKAVDYNVPSTLDLDSPGVSSSYVSKGIKRKYTSMDHPISMKDGSLVVLGLGPSPNSCTSTCLERIIEDDFSMDLGLSINLNRGSNRLSLPKKVPTRTSKGVEERRAPVDLELSLSTGPTESDVTTVTTLEFTPCQNYSELPVFAPTIQLVDEGSTSSRWKAGPLISPLKSQEIPVPYDDCCSGHANPVAPNTSSTAVVNLDGQVSGVVNKPKRKITVKSCRYEGCTRGARGASGLCIAHGGGRRCQKTGCQRGAEGKTVFCKAHGGGRRCQHLGCTKSAEGHTDYCIGHGGGRRCNHEGCTRAARGKSGLCIRHGGGKRCKIENCTRSAEGISGLCISHGGGRRCQYPECKKGAQGSTMFCKGHGGGRRCTFLGCRKGAEGSTPFCKGHGGGKRCTAEGCPKSVHGGTLFCVSHGGGKRCAMPECNKSARGRTNYCVRHGGGKRCKFEGCPKSAQGSTDFCKAHGGGRKCLWGQPGSEYGSPGATPCDKFARGKSGLCVAHGTQVHEKEIYESSSTSTQIKNIFGAGITSYPCSTSECGTASYSSEGYAHHFTSSMPILAPENFVVGNACLNHLSLPEGRVHGGRLMAMLRGSMGMSKKPSEEGSGQLELDKSVHMSHKWV